eukprot:TRINITY_DN1062_c0_g1_i1.p1 TRINITY_DN1062_c0_g1~~TRINITY_DN1062_c0_g1_i1.p1  ORF type:complete len:320 (+),score=64.81 TRINITY_DN1062_c0_g1_i1:57-962(+)
MSRLIVIGGGTGFIGRALGSALTKRGHAVMNISRTAGKNNLTWADLAHKGLPRDTKAVVQLSGANIMDKTWTPERKKELIESRVEPTKMLVEAIKKATSPPEVFVSGSAVGIYPSDPSQTFDESSPVPSSPPVNFPSELCLKWEEAGRLPSDLESRVRHVTIRTGVVLDAEGGALPQMIFPFKFGFGGMIGSGKQYMPWIALDDIVGLFVHAIENPNVKGVLNGVAPEAATNSTMTSKLGKVMSRPTFMSVPAFAINTMFGERAMMVLEGSQIVPTATLASGYMYQYPSLEGALDHVLTKK